MQVNINSNISKINSYYINPNRSYNNNITSPISASQNNIIFNGNTVISKTVSSKIATEKAKLLRNFKEILATMKKEA